MAGEYPSTQTWNMVLIFAPHTSYWDGLWAVLVALKAKLYLRWLIKGSLYNKFPCFFKLIGGIPVKNVRDGLVKFLIDKFNENANLKLALSPEGTRRKVSSWKLGFYYIALEHNLPIGFGYMDYRNKTLGCDTLLLPSGDLGADYAKIAAFYANVHAKHPEKFNNLKLSERQSASFQNGKQEFSSQ
jgi:1-acyl-sn-glycerol-3-phosphate acyltransferase